MEFTLNDQMKCLGNAYLWGVFLGVIYDVLRMSRILFKRGRVATFVCDIIFMLCFSFVSLFFSMAYSYGKPRLFSIISQVCGVLTVRFTIGLISVSIFERIYGFILKIFKKILIKSKKSLKKLLQVKHKMLYNKVKDRGAVETNSIKQ